MLLTSDSDRKAVNNCQIDRQSILLYLLQSMLSSTHLERGHPAPAVPRQRFGTNKVSASFPPIMLAWFGSIAMTGVCNDIAKLNPPVLKAVSPQKGRLRATWSHHPVHHRREI